MRNEWLDQHGGFTLTDERRSRSDDSLGTRDAHGPEEEDGELADEPLDETPVVQELHERNEEDDGGDDTSEEPTLCWHSRICEEDDTVVGEPEEQTGKLRDEVEDVETNAGSQHEKGDDELSQHSNDDGVPVDHLLVAGGQPEGEDEDSQTEEGDGTVGTRVVLALLTSHGTDDDDSNGKGSASGNTHLLGDELSDSDSSVVPDPVHWLGDDGDGDVARDQADHDGQPEQKRNDPVLVIAVHDDRRNPPSNVVSSNRIYSLTSHCVAHPVKKAPMRMCTGSLNRL
ncbi:hypothetical protein M3J09_012060 [Ascochyta lentis]